MAPTDLQNQTNNIVLCLFDDQAGCIETDGIGDEDGFDPVKIASKLREIGDDYDEKRIQPLIKCLEQAASDQMVSAFSSSVESLCQSWVVQRSEVASEKDLLKASVAVALYVKKNCPDMVGTVQDAMAAFLNTRLANWVASQGGWDNAISC
ncbi:hypothetical protein AALO_G00142850 [Alosa alosa]|uniref:Bcl-2 Bcl-2 homology region 1-3 domain-containing protein n=1 Tax=Alosa alosa TaxID=278164 RepID=A0AAV6GQ91_9TELE|nr:hypothetical protein AALO_G00142850 [Alosa alosa]